MPPTHIIDVDLAKVHTEPDANNKQELTTTLAWGDSVEVLEITSKHVKVLLTHYHELSDGSFFPQTVPGVITPSKSSKIKPREVVREINESRVLKVDFVDVQQGDAAVVETPGGKVMFIDGGDNQLFARYLASRYRDTSLANPQVVECIVITHGDADHFAGLNDILNSETHRRAFKRCFIQPKRVYHNGLVKRPNSVTEKEQLGAIVEDGGITLITGLEDDLLAVDDAEMNEFFQSWKQTLKTYHDRSPVEIQRLQSGDQATFGFLANEGLKVEVLGPVMTDLNGQRGLRFLGNPPNEPRIGHPSFDEIEAGFKGKSAGHTINGHSIILRLQYGKFRFLFAGDLNEQAELGLLREHVSGLVNLRSEVLKVPHHGSADFLPQFIEAVSPVISVISSGDENARKEYIHPRATLVGALGRFSRLPEPIIFVTEMVAFFTAEGGIRPEFHKLDGSELVLRDGEAQVIKKKKERGWFYAFSRTAFGTVKVRTNGERLLIFANSGLARLKEAYAFTVDAIGEPHPAPIRQV